jgi:hypothetical protein
MNESTEELLDAVQRVLLRSWLMGLFVLLLWLAATLLMEDSVLEGMVLKQAWLNGTPGCGHATDGRGISSGTIPPHIRESPRVLDR